MALTESAGAAYTTASATVLTSGSFSPTSGNLLVACVGVGNGNGSPITNITMTDSSGGGSWTQLVQAGTYQINSGAAVIFMRAAWSGSHTGTATIAGGGADLSMIIRQFAGAAPVASQTGATASNIATIQNLPVTPKITGSQVVGAFGTSFQAESMTAATGTSIYGQFEGANGDTSSCIEASSLSTGGTPVTLGFTNTAENNAFSLAEILPASTNPVGFELIKTQAVNRSAVYG